MRKPRLILASQSPRRRELLEKAGYQFRVIEPSPDAEDGMIAGENPADLVQRLATQKAQDVASRIHVGTADHLVVGCDTVAVCDDEVLGKPCDRNHACQMLQRMRGKEHFVVSGICLCHHQARVVKVAVEQTMLVMDDISDQQIEDYLETDLWVGKAGAFGFQDGLNWISIKHGSESNVVGLPMELLAHLLIEFETSSP